MSNTNYFNPISYKPQDQGMMGASVGYDHQMDRQRFAQMADLQKALIAMQAAKEHEELTQGHGVRQAQRGSQTANFNLEEALSRDALGNPNYAPSMTRGKIGEAQTKEATGRFDMGVVDSKIQSTNAGNRVKTLEDQAREFEIRAAASPMENEMAYQSFRKGAPNWITLPERYSPEVPKYLRKISDMVRDNPAHRRTIDQETVKGNLDIEKQRVANQGALATATARTGAKISDYNQGLLRASTTQHIMSLAQQIQMDTELPEDKRASLMARAKAAYDAMVRLEASRADARNPGIRDSIDGGVGNNIQRRLSGEGDPLGQQRYVPGQVYKGRTGMFRYIGPANPTPQQLQDRKNWQPVNAQQ